MGFFNDDDFSKETLRLLEHKIQTLADNVEIIRKENRRLKRSMLVIANTISKTGLVELRSGRGTFGDFDIEIKWDAVDAIKYIAEEGVRHQDRHTDLSIIVEAIKNLGLVKSTNVSYNRASYTQNTDFIDTARQFLNSKFVKNKVRKEDLEIMKKRMSEGLKYVKDELKRIQIKED